MIYFIKGYPNSGKTQLIKEKIIPYYLKMGRRIGGIYTQKRIYKNYYIYEVVNIINNKKTLLCSPFYESNISQGIYKFNPEGIKFGIDSIKEALNNKVEILIIDEVGPLELKGKGWHSILNYISYKKDKYLFYNLFITLRPSIDFLVIYKFFFNFKSICIEINNTENYNLFKIFRKSKKN